jgi:hypothetical protein
MSYAELGRARGISAPSAKRLSNRRRWRKQAGNDGTTRVAVPVGEAVPRETDPEDISGDVPPIHTQALAALQDAVSALRAQLADANTRTDRALSLLADAEAVLTAERQRSVATETALAAERLRADALRDRLDSAEAAARRANADAQGALKAAAELRQAVADRKARGRLRRAWDGWRGR